MSVWSIITHSITETKPLTDSNKFLSCIILLLKNMDYVPHNSK